MEKSEMQKKFELLRMMDEDVEIPVPDDSLWEWKYRLQIEKGRVYKNNKVKTERGYENFRRKLTVDPPESFLHIKKECREKKNCDIGDVEIIDFFILLFKHKQKDLAYIHEKEKLREYLAKYPNLYSVFWYYIDIVQVSDSLF